LAVPESLRLAGQTPGRHFRAEGKFLFLLSGHDLHFGQHRPHAIELVVQTIAGERIGVGAYRRSRSRPTRPYASPHAHTFLPLFLPNSFR
jgi:hypothetical protein